MLLLLTMTEHRHQQQFRWHHAHPNTSRYHEDKIWNNNNKWQPWKWRQKEWKLKRKKVKFKREKQMCACCKMDSRNSDSLLFWFWYFMFKSAYSSIFAKTIFILFVNRRLSSIYYYSRNLFSNDISHSLEDHRTESVNGQRVARIDSNNKKTGENSCNVPVCLCWCSMWFRRLNILNDRCEYRRAKSGKKMFRWKRRSKWQNRTTKTHTEQWTLNIEHRTLDRKNMQFATFYSQSTISLSHFSFHCASFFLKYHFLMLLLMLIRSMCFSSVFVC